MTERTPSDAHLKAVKKYKQKVKRLTIDFHPSETDLWDQVNGQPNKQGYIKTLIRADIEKHGCCWVCEDEGRFDEIVCYLPNDNGGATDVPLNFCPKCGADMERGGEDA